MIETLKILEQLESLGDARNAKVELLEANKHNNDLKSIFVYTYDWLRTYGLVGKIPDEKGEGDPDQNFQELLRLLDAFSARELTGHAARDAWKEFLLRCNDLERKWYTRVLNRDLRIKMGAKLVKKVWPDALSPFGCQLALDYEKSKPEFPLVMEPKLDGMRVILVCRGSKAGCFSREGRPLPALQRFADTALHAGTDFVLDGEVFHTDWNTTVSLAKTKHFTAEKEEKIKNMVFYAFDYLSYVEFDSGGSDEPQYERKHALRQVVDRIGRNDKFQILASFLIENEDQIEPTYEKLLSYGFEGGMLKKPNAPYRMKRCDAWMKIKPETDIDARIVGVHHGTGRNEHRMGALEIELEDGTLARIGTGYSDQQRGDLWDRKGEIVGKIAEFRVQKDADSVASARFPRFLRIREDRE